LTGSWCNWTQMPAFEDLPINCINKDLAAATCKSFGKELPSEAQYEFAATGRGAEWAYPWGNDEPTCDDAVWGRGGFGGPTAAYGYADSDCRPSSDFGGTLPGAIGRLDRVALTDGAGARREVVDLA